jgi:ATP-dependent RNA helicase DeaD
MNALTGIMYKGREVRCNDADQGGSQKADGGKKRKDESRGGKKKDRKNRKPFDDFGNFNNGTTGDWRELMKPKKWDLKGKEPDFSEEGWAIRKPRKKKN